MTCAGQLYGPSTHRMMSSAPVHHVNTGDTVTVYYDGIAGTLAYGINGAPTGVVFNNLRGLTLYPAAGTYLSNRCVWGSQRSASIRCSSPSAVLLPRSPLTPPPLHLSVLALRSAFKFIRAGEVTDFPAMPLPGGYAEEFFAGVPAFDIATSSSSSDLTFANEAHTVSSKTGTNSMAVCTRGFGRGKAAVEFRLDTDTKDNEMTALGFTTKPLASHSYDNGASAFMVRCYNGAWRTRGPDGRPRHLPRLFVTPPPTPAAGQLYGPGARSSNAGKIHPSDIVRFEWDSEPGEREGWGEGTGECVGARCSGHTAHA